MSEGLIAAAANAVEAFGSRRMTKRPCRSVAAIRYHETCNRFGHRRTRRVFLRVYIHASATLFALGNRREARRFYDGAFLFGNRTAVRTELLAACVRLAGIRPHATDTQAIWGLVCGAMMYRPDDLTAEDVWLEFSRSGIQRDALGERPAFVPSFALV
jgi:hypothetical protein